MDAKNRRMWRSGYAFLVLMAASLLLASCAQTSPSATSPYSSNRVAPARTPTTEAPARVTATPTSATPPLAGSVTLTLNQQRYSTYSLIIVTIHNGTQHTIWAADHQTNCTVLALERLAQGSWTRVGQCSLLTPTRIIPIAPGAVLAQRLSSSTGWISGIYRVSLNFHYGSGATDLGPGGVVHSATFSIG